MIVIDMDMPNTCNECIFCRNYGCAITRMSVESSYKTHQKYPWCPIVAELPKGHGRLIDADVLVDGMEDDYEFCEAVNATPTIIEADKE